MNTEKNSDKHDEEYSFIQEKIAPKAKNSKKKFMKQVTMTVSFAVLFGAVSSIVFSASNHLIQWGTGNDDTPITLNDSAGVTQEPESTVTEDDDETNDLDDQSLSDYTIAGSLSIKSYQKIYSLMSDIQDDVKTSMVTVVAYEEAENWLDFEESESSYGVIVADDTSYVYMLCTYSKIKDVDKVEVKFYNDETKKAALYSYDADTDLAILRVKKSKLSKRTSQNISEISFGDSYQLEAATPILGLGAVNGYMNSLEIGYITGPGISKYIVDGKLEIYHTSLAENADGSGFFVNLSGQVIGILTHDYKEEGDADIMSFIGISRLRTIIEDMLNEQKNAYLGIKSCELTSDEAEAYGVNNGIYVTEVVADSPAFEDGMKSGDVITEVDGKSIGTVSGLVSCLRGHEPKDTMTIKVIRRTNSEYPKITLTEKTIKVTLGEKSLGLANQN